MEKEKLTDEITAKIAGGTKTFTRKFIEIKEVGCVGCGENFKLPITYMLPRHMMLEDFFAMKKRRCTCPSCGFVNFQYTVFK